MYQPNSIEPKWQKFWEENHTFRTLSPSEAGGMPKKYILDMFPYPSGAGLHVGHPKGYVATDIVSRYYRNCGFNVLHPMGFDAFGLPAENYAIKTGTHPAVTTAQNIANYVAQLKLLGFSYDWSRMIDSTNPEYYKWTQWIFLELFKRGLAYEQDLPINYCPSCKTGLANEEVLSDNTCDRCGTKVERRAIRQWVLKITAYADRLIEDIDGLDWPEGIKEMQKNWIGKSEGCEFRMKKSDDASVELGVYTTRIDTVYGMTYAVIAPDHKGVSKWIAASEAAACQEYIADAKGKSDLDRTGTKEKTGVFTGSYAVNPFNGESIPVYLGDYVLGSYGTGAVMAVPAHDERDFEFAKKMGLPVVQSVDVGGDFDTNVWKAEYANDGTVLATGKSSEETRSEFASKAESEDFGSKKVNYKLRDWLFSRQRYWGEPIPLIHLDVEDLKKLPHISKLEEATDASLAYILKRDPKEGESSCDGATCGGKVRELVIGGKVYSKIYDGIYSKIVIDSKLPLELPEVERYEPAGDGQSPLATVPSFVNMQLASNLPGKRETNTMPQWGGSCWYYLRYMDTLNSDALASKEAIDYWGMVDEYVGGAEHAVLHLLYARFWHKVLFDLGVVPNKEPFQKLTNVGMILAYAYERPDGGLVAVDMVEEKNGKFFEKSNGNEVKQVVAKMSKSLKNVVNPDDVAKEYGIDTFRLYEMSMSGFTDTAPWNTDAIIGVRRFLDKVSAAFEKPGTAKDDMKAMKLLHKTIKKVSEDIVGYKFNTAISALMILINEGVPVDTEDAKEWKTAFATMLHPFAPHLSEELWANLGNTTSVYTAAWPKYEEFMLTDDEVTIAVQVNGKLRGTVTVLNGTAQEEVASLAREDADIAKWIEGKELVREIFVPNKLLSIVVKDL